MDGQSVAYIAAVSPPLATADSLLLSTFIARFRSSQISLYLILCPSITEYIVLNRAQR